MALPEFEKDMPRAVLGLRRRLRNLGFEEAACRDLHRLMEDSSDPVTRLAAIREWIEWHLNRGDQAGARACLGWFEPLAESSREPQLARADAVMEAEAHARLNDPVAALRALQAAPDWERDPDLLLARANLAEDDCERLDWINRVMAIRELEPLELDPEAGRTLFDGLRVPSVAPASVDDGPLVTVLVPAHDSERTLATALASLSAQSWAPLEILVVDDASRDDTRQVALAAAEQDPRIRLIRNDFNRGPYFCRNLGLNVAAGELVTCHDADDWSHPRKIEQQARYLQRHSGIMANTSGQVRASDALQFHRRGKRGHYIFPNVSSLMFRRMPVMDALGYWDVVRFAADAEFIARLQQIFGADAIADIAPGPLAFMRQGEDSLTADDAFGFPGWFMGARKEYREAQTWFHRRSAAKSDQLYYEFPQRTRPFPVPEPLWPDREIEAGGVRDFDVVVACDFRLENGATISALEEVKANTRAGLRTGLMSTARYEADPLGRRVPHRVRRVLDGDRVQMVVRGERIRCDLLIVRDPASLVEVQDYLPQLQPRSVHVIVDRATATSVDALPAERLTDVLSRVRDWTGRDPLWWASSEPVRERLREHAREQAVALEIDARDWVPVINARWWHGERNAPGRQPVRVGRLGRIGRKGAPVAKPGGWRRRLMARWHRGWEERVLGSLDSHRELPLHLRRIQQTSGSMHPRDFLAKLDALLHYPEPGESPRPARPVLEAMACGVPVLLPPAWREIFGDAAIYAEPGDIHRTVRRLVADDSLWREQVRRGREYVIAYHDYAVHQERIREFLGSENEGGSENETESRTGLHEVPDSAEGFQTLVDDLRARLDERELPYIEHRAATARHELILPADRAREVRDWLAGLEGDGRFHVLRRQRLVRENLYEVDGREIGLPAATDFWWVSARAASGSEQRRNARWRVRVSFFSEYSTGRVFHLRMPFTRVLPADSALPAALGELWGRARQQVSGRLPVADTQPDFPVDAVIAWVDDGDPEWRQRFEGYRAQTSGQGTPASALNSSRFRNRDELRYCLRALRMYAPFLRRIFVVSDGQVPGWFDVDHDGPVRFVSHQDIFDQDTTYPVFSSRPIELNLHRIEGLAEHFIYLNDDFFPCGPMDVQDFFHPNGLACFFESPRRLDARPASASDRASVTAHKNAARAFEQRFGVSLTRKPMHAPIPARRSECEALQQDFPEAVRVTKQQRFRSWKDVSWTQMLPLYMLYRGAAVRGTLESRYVDAADPSVRERLAELDALPEVRNLCINDTDELPDEAAEAFLRQWLAERFALTAPWEKGTDQP